jgi:4-coumarate--CoA ligase
MTKNVYIILTFSTSLFNFILLSIAYPQKHLNMGTYIENGVEEHEHIFHSQYSPVPVPDNVTLPEFVLQNVEFYGDKVAFVDAESGKEVTYSEVARDIHRFSKALRSLGLRKGSVVIVVLPNVVEYAIVALGIMDSGGVFSGANPASHTSEIKKQVESADAKLIVTNSTTHEKVTPSTS